MNSTIRLDKYAFVFKGALQLILPMIVLTYFITNGFNLSLFLASLLAGFLNWHIGMGVAHRIFAHRVVTIASLPLKILLTYLATVCMTSPPRGWATIHILHHLKTDTDLDPHNPTRLGFPRCLSFAYYMTYDKILPNLTFKEKKVYLAATKHLNDPVIMFFERFFPLVLVLHIAAIASFGLDAFIYAFCIPIIVTQVAEILSVINHSGKLGGQSIPAYSQGRNKFRFSWITGLESQHADHHKNPRGNDMFNTIIRKIF